MDDFDPQELFDTVERIRDAFNRAAELDSGTATPLFKQLAHGIDRLHTIALDPQNQGGDPSRLLMKALPTVMEIQMTAKRLEQEAKRNPQAAVTMEILLQDVNTELQSILPKLGGLLGNLPKIPGLPDLGDIFNQQQPPRPREEPKPAQPQPPKPKPTPKRNKDNDDFKF